MTYTVCEAKGCRESVPFISGVAPRCPAHEGMDVDVRPRWSPEDYPGVDVQSEHDRRRGYAPGQRGHL